jgi:hypothetical protein
MYRKRRNRIGLLSAGLATLWTNVSASAPPPRANGPCTKSSQQAREHAQAGHLRRARAAFMECAKTSCGGLISRQCQSGLQQLDTDMPSVIPVVTNASGAQQVEVRVAMDGELLTSRIDGRSLDVDPGMHEFSFSMDDGTVHTEKVLILQGQRNRVMSVQLEAAPAASADPAKPAPSSEPDASTSASAVEQAAPPASAPSKTEAPPAVDAGTTRGSPLLAYIVGGAGLAAVGSSFLLAHWGREDDILLDRCAPNCSQKSVDHVSNMYIAADITLGAGIVALGAATWIYLARPDVEDTKSAQTYRFDVQPTASGAYATVERSF